MYLSELWFSQGTRTEEPGRLQSMGSPSVGHNLATKQQQIPSSGIAVSYGSLRNLHTVLYSDLTIYIPPNSVDVVAVTKQQDGWDGGGVGEGSEMEGMYVYTQLVHFVLQQKLTRPCKAVTRQCLKLKQTNEPPCLQGHLLQSVLHTKSEETFYSSPHGPPTYLTY